MGDEHPPELAGRPKRVLSVVGMNVGTPGGTVEGVVVALDVDGVLLDPDRGGRGPWQVAFSQQFDVEASQLGPAYFQRVWRDVIVGRDPIETTLSAAMQGLGWDIDVDDALRCWFEADFVVAPEVVDAANDWSRRGIRVVLATNQEIRRARYIEQRLATLIPLCGMAFSGALGILKADPAFYAAAERQLGITPDRTSVVFVDDTEENVKAARRHGWKSVLFSRESDCRRATERTIEGELGDRSSG
jgi:putative hydrolase of the HAD superfamily